MESLSTFKKEKHPLACFMPKVSMTKLHPSGQIFIYQFLALISHPYSGSSLDVQFSIGRVTVKQGKKGQQRRTFLGLVTAGTTRYQAQAVLVRAVGL